MNCKARRRATDTHFGREIGRRDLERYRATRPDKTTQLMVDGIRETGERYGHLPDVGAGIGVLVGRVRSYVLAADSRCCFYDNSEVYKPRGLTPHGRRKAA